MKNYRISIFLCWACFLSFANVYPHSSIASPAKDTVLFSAYLKLSHKYSGNNIRNHDSAIYYLNKAFDVSARLNDDKYLYKVYSGFAQLYGKTGNYSEALEYNFKILNLLDNEMKTACETLPVKKKYETLYRNIAFCFHLSNPGKSLIYFKKSLSMAQSIYQSDSTYNIDGNRLTVYSNIGSVFLSCSKLDSAEFYYKKAMQYIPQKNEKHYLATLYNNLGSIAWERGKYLLAEEYFVRSLTYFTHVKDTTGLAKVYLNLGKCSFARNIYPEALRSYLTSLNFSKKIPDARIELHALNSLAEAYEKLNKHKDANDMLKQADVIKDRLSGSEKVKISIAAEMQYQFQKRKEESELQQKILVAGKERRLLLSLFAASILSLLLIVLFLLYRNQRIKARQSLIEQDSLALKNENLKLKNQQLEQNLEHKDKEIDLHARYLLKKNDFVSSVVRQISESKEKEKNELATMIDELKSDIEDSVWNEFKILFQSLHNDFYANLHEKHPNLTSNEKKLCVFIRLNMSSKEISSVTLQQVKTIEVARSRLRSKLNLGRSENLTSYLQQF